MNQAIRAEGLAKRFKETTALSGVDLVARTGTVTHVLAVGAPAGLAQGAGIAVVFFPLAMRAYRARI